jgi:hypothetical protein
MNTQEKEQIFRLLQNIEESKKYIATFSDLCIHPFFGATFSEMKKGEKAEVQSLIKQYIEQRVSLLNKTKGGQLFQRFFDTQPDLFWEFRALNEDTETAQSKEFQEVGQKVEHELFKLEGILTEKMLNQEKGLDKVVDAFYTIIYLFFPRFNLLD